MKKYSLQKICRLSHDVADNGMPDWANLVGSTAPADLLKSNDLAGGGVYACFWDDKLIYIGSFVGPKEDPFSGHVAERIYKHVMGFTLRAQKLGFSKRPLRSIIANLDHPIARDLQNKRRGNDRLEGGSIKATYNKARFAAQHWDELRDAAPETLLERFSFTYRRIAPAGVSIPDKHSVRKFWIKPIERQLIQHFEPICNTEFRARPDGMPVGFGEVVEAFESAFRNPLPELGVTTSQTRAALMPNNEPDHEDSEDVIPADPRWLEYYTADGQLRVRAASDEESSAKGRTLLIRESAKRVTCLATVDRLAAVGIEAKRVQRGPLVSSVTVEFDGDLSERSALLREILSVCLANLQIKAC